MKLHQMEHRSQTGMASFGAIWPRGTVKEVSQYCVRNAQGEEIPVQSAVTAYWPDHSVKWTSHCAEVSKLGAAPELIPVETAGQKASMEISETEQEILVQLEKGSVTIPKSGKKLLTNLVQPGKKTVEYAETVLILEEPVEKDGDVWKHQVTYQGEIQCAEVETCGPLKCVIRIDGVYQNEKHQRSCCPFILRITIWKNGAKMDFQHTYLYDGDEKKDYLKGLGIRFYTKLQGPVFNRHIRMQTDYGTFHESCVLLTSWRPRLPLEIYQAQMDGKKLPGEGEAAEALWAGVASMPVWSNYRMAQDSAEHFLIEKQTDQQGCGYIPVQHGRRAGGALCFGDEEGGLMLGKKDFWQKYPSGMEVNGLAEDQTSAVIWFYSPQANAFDYRHYANRGYSQSYYEGFDEFGATPYGIANTNNCTLAFYDGMIADEEALAQFSLEVQKPAVYLGEISYYHENRAFGYWSMESKETEMEQWLEAQLDQAVSFYQQEAEQRSWYGFYDYGDFMHTYDRVRHCWKYDMGGYAWQNTELVPTLWLWLYFMRTQREDVFVLAEAMSRHCSDVDTYHMGPYKGIGSRHNVRHWGCPCKEARIGMAGHHRYYYYLTGDGRMQDIFADAKDADYAILEIDPLRHFYDKDKMVYPTHARSGPDWSSFCSNWMTQWERFDDVSYLEKIKVGVEDIKKAPLKLVSGSDFEYDPKSGHLRYIGERAAGGSHLQICMGAAQVWSELTLLLEDPEWTKIFAEYGRFYYLDRETQLEESRGLIGNREFSLPFMAAAAGAFGAAYLKDEELAKTTWRILMRALVSDNDKDGFVQTELPKTANKEVLKEISWISTNFVSQWCLNVIMVLDFIREVLPADWSGMDELLAGMPQDGYHRA